MSTLKMINAGWLIDGSGDPVRASVRLRILNGCIDSIQDSWANLHGQRRPDGDVEILDLSDATVLPALVDSHVHLTMSGTMDQDKRLRQLDLRYDRSEEIIRRHLTQHLGSHCGYHAGLRPLLKAHRATQRHCA